MGRLMHKSDICKMHIKIMLSIAIKHLQHCYLPSFGLPSINRHQLFSCHGKLNFGRKKKQSKTLCLKPTTYHNQMQAEIQQNKIITIISLFASDMFIITSLQIHSQKQIKVSKYRKSIKPCF